MDRGEEEEEGGNKRTLPTLRKVRTRLYNYTFNHNNIMQTL